MKTYLWKQKDTQSVSDWLKSRSPLWFAFGKQKLQETELLDQFIQLSLSSSSPFIFKEIIF